MPFSGWLGRWYRQLPQFFDIVLALYRLGALGEEGSKTERPGLQIC